MTQNQISWYRAKEEKRHNVVSEGETIRHNVQEEQIGWEGNRIKDDANVINQYHFERMDAETRRHNKVGERQTQTGLRQRNKEIQLNRRSINEVKRHDLELEHNERYRMKEQYRHNLATEGIDWANVGIGRMNAATNAENAATNWQNAVTNSRNAELRAGELDLSRDRYSLDQWASSQITPAQQSKLEAERDLAQSRKEYQDTQTRAYYIDLVGDILAGASPYAGGMGQNSSTGSPKPRTIKTPKP